MAEHYIFIFNRVYRTAINFFATESYCGRIFLRLNARFCPVRSAGRASVRPGCAAEEMRECGGGFFIFRLEMQIFSLKIHISKLEIHIFRLKMKILFYAIEFAARILWKRGVCLSCFPVALGVTAASPESGRRFLLSLPVQAVHLCLQGRFS